MGGDDMDNLINSFVLNPRDPRANFDLALEYERINHYAGAITHFQRCAEYGHLEENKDLIYESLLHISLLLGKLGNREQTQEGFILHAITFQPKRPEAYWLSSLMYEKRQQWQESYTMANLGLQYVNGEASHMISDIGFDERYMLLFQKAVTAWWVGLRQEARDIFFQLPEYPLNQEYIKFVQNNITNLGTGNYPYLTYTKDKMDKLKVLFPGIETIERNYSQVLQDMFVLSVLDGKKKGYYVEIGSADPYLGSNTCLLEKNFGWKGISVEFQESLVDKFRKERSNPVICRDATTINYSMLLKGLNAPKEIDYLQIDCDPPKATYDILLSIPFEEYKFAVITFEHDYYADASRSYRSLSRTFLESHGYKLLAGNISYNREHSFEDWWVHPDLVDESVISRMKCEEQPVTFAEDYMLKKEKKFNWGSEVDNEFIYIVNKEIFNDNVYQQFFKVNEGDVVVDIGASVGPFAYSIIEQNPSIVYCIEPNPVLFRTLVENTKDLNTVLINSGISKTNGKTQFKNIYGSENEELKAFETTGISFKSFVNKYHIKKIDFLKLDCEGGEYDIFTQENLPWIKNNVRKIAGEWHLYDEETKKKFRDFRDHILPHFNYEVYSMDGINIKWDLWNDHFIEYYKYITIYIDNRNTASNIPIVNWISLPTSADRQSFMINQLEKLNLKHKMVEAYDGRVIDYMNNPIAIYQNFTDKEKVLNSGSIATSMSHLKAIKEWYEETDESYGFFIEDDLNLSTINLWNFKWTDVIKKLPEGWKIVQLSLIKDDLFTYDDMKFSPRKWNNWAAFAYLIDRKYAKELIDKHITENGEYNLILPNNLIPFPENILFGDLYSDVYTLPLFAENNNVFISSFYPIFIDTEYKKSQKESSDFILNWWKENEHKDQLTLLFNPT